MDRRRFLGVGGLAAASPLLPAMAAGAAPRPHRPAAAVDFASDGLGLSPPEYAAVLAEVAAEDGFAAGGFLSQVFCCDFTFIAKFCSQSR